MKLWEVLKRLEEDPKKTYELKDGNTRTWTITTDYDDDYPELEVYYMIECSSDCDIHGNINPSDNGWQEVKQPVTWQEAIQGRAEGKNVNVEVNHQIWSLVELVRLPEYLTIALERGAWYVED